MLSNARAGFLQWVELVLGGRTGAGQPDSAGLHGCCQASPAPRPRLAAPRATCKSVGAHQLHQLKGRGGNGAGEAQGHSQGQGQLSQTASGYNCLHF